tara:strand:+ start:172 stop:594 length:423 start_codon:yes stop_codon:yes gene_type:complete
MKNIEIIPHIISVLNNRYNEYIKSVIKDNSIEGVVPNHGPLLRVIIDTSDGIAVTELSQRVNRPKPTVTEMLNKLERLGHIERVSVETDKRMVYVKATETGRKVDEILFRAVGSFLEDMLCDFSGEEKEKLWKLLIKAYR